MKLTTGCILITCFLLSSCAQLSTFHSARTEGKGNLSITPTLSGYAYTSSGGGGEIGSGTLPFLQLEMAYGLSENLDLVGSISSGGNFLGSVKYKMIGSNASQFSLSVMPGYEYQNGVQNSENYASRLHLPLIASYYTSDDMGFFAAPKYVIQIANGEEVFSFPGISAGVILNRKMDFVIGGGTFIPISYPVGAQGMIFQVGASVRIPLISK